MKILFLSLLCLVLSVQVNFGQFNAQVPAKEYERKADTLFKYFKYDSASFYYSKAAKLYEQNKQWLPCVKNYRLSSTAFLTAVKYDTALLYCQRAFQVAETYFHESSKVEMFEKSDVLIKLAHINEKKGKFDQEITLCKKALELVLKTDTSAKLKIAGTWNEIGWAYNNLTDYDSALYFCKKALDERIQLLERHDVIVADSYYRIGEIYLKIGEYNKALDFLNKALPIFILAYGENHPDVARCYNDFGSYYFNMGEYNEALINFQKALHIFVLIYGKNYPSVANSYNNIGVIYTEKGEYDKALEFYQKALHIRISVYGENTRVVALCYNNIGIVYAEKGEYDKALEFHQKALFIFISIDGENHPDIANVYINIGLIYYIKREYDKALEFYQKALHIWIPVFGENNSHVANSFSNIGLIYDDKGEYDKALEFHQKALCIRISVLGGHHPSVAKSYNHIGDTYSKKGETFKALQLYQKGFMSNIVDFTDSAIYNNPTIKKSLSASELLQTLTGKANAFYQLNKTRTNSYRDLDASLQTYELAFQLINNMRNEYNAENTKLLLSEATKNFYAQAIHIATAYDKISPLQKNGSKPFEFIEKGKSASLTAKFNELDAKHFAGIPDSIVDTEKDLQTKIGFYTTQISNLKSQKDGYDTLKVSTLENEEFTCSRRLDSLITYFETTYPAYYELKYTEKTATVPEIQKIVDHNTAILNYFVGDSSLFITAITDSINKIEEIKIDSTFMKLVFNYYNSIKAAETDSFIINSQQLYEKLIQPVKGYIAGKEHLVVIPDDYLYYVPFETLIDNAASPKITYNNYAELDYLIKSHSISYNHSATLWYNSKKREGKWAANRKMNFVGFAPVFSKEKNNGVIVSSNVNAIDTTGNNLAYRSISSDLKRFNPLPYSKDEVTSIVHLFEKHKKEAKAYIYSEANETNFKNNTSNYSIIHVSSHGFANDKEPDLSGIVFSQPTDTSEKEDGILYTGETYNLNLKADLVVLSSCESGLGKLIKGEGLQALSRGFLYAGAPNIIFSLWKALDKPTKEVMVQFYSNVLDGKSYAEALRLAKLDLIKNPGTAFPHFWGGFVLVGR